MITGLIGKCNFVYQAFSCYASDVVDGMFVADEPDCQIPESGQPRTQGYAISASWTSRYHPGCRHCRGS